MGQTRVSPIEHGVAAVLDEDVAVVQVAMVDGRRYPTVGEGLAPGRER